MSKMNKVKSRLGRGLNSLISMPDETEEGSEPGPELTPSEPARASATMDAENKRNESPGQRVVEVAVDQIRANPHQPRRDFKEASIADLAMSLKSTGLIQPILVRQTPNGYELIAGERRLRAAKVAGLVTLPAIVKEVDGFTQAQMALVENIQREDLNPVDRALAYRVLIEQLGLTQAELAGRLGEDRTSVTHHLRLLDLTDNVRAAVSSGELTMGHAKLLVGVNDPAQQETWAARVQEEHLSVRKLEQLLKVQAAQLTTPPPPAVKKPPHIQDVERSLERQLGVKVRLHPAAKKGKGRLVIHYASLDQFDELVNRLGVKTEDWDE